MATSVRFGPVPCGAYMPALKRGVAAGRSAQRACERSSDWRRGAAGSPDPDYVLLRPIYLILCVAELAQDFGGVLAQKGRGAAHFGAGFGEAIREAGGLPVGHFGMGCR